jgi:uncharacterized protein (TIGR03437 family)
MPARLIAGFMLTLATLSAQISALVAPGSGDDLYFVTGLTLKGSKEPGQGRVYKVGTVPVTPVVDIPHYVPPGACHPCLSNAYNVYASDLSRDGKVMVYTASLECLDFCIHITESFYSYVTGYPGASASGLVFGGFAKLSGNGRYVATTGVDGDNVPDFSLYDLQTSKTIVGGSLKSTGLAGIGSNGRAVADDGTIVLSGGHISVYRHGQWINGPNFTYALDPVIDAAGDTVLYEAQQNQSHWQIRYLHPDTAEEGLLIQADAEVDAPTITMDGQRFAFQSNAKFAMTDTPSGTYQVYMANIDLSDMRQLTHEASGISQYILSDDGKNMWYTSTQGGVFQVNTASGQATKQFAACSVYSYTNATAPGSGIIMQSTPPCFTSQTQLTLGGERMPTFVQQPGSAWAQVPWDLPASSATPIGVNIESPFQLTGAIDVYAILPSWFAGYIHQDFSATVDYRAPAHPGEIIHLFATGLGPVQPPVPTGAVGPTNPLARVVTPVDCNLPVVFAGLAPGLIGLYQISLQIPASAAGTQNVTCLGISSDLPIKP